LLSFESLLEFYRKSDGCIFAEKLVLEKGKVATSTFTEPIQFILRISEVLGSYKKKQEVDFDLLCLWVPPTDKSCNQLTDQFISNTFMSSPVMSHEINRLV
jgi:hypothetical protein